MIDVSNENGAGYLLLLEMAFQTERRVALVQQSLVDGPVRRMTDDTALAHCLMFIDKRAALRGVTLETGFVSAQKRQATAFERLLHIGRHCL